MKNHYTIKFTPIVNGKFQEEMITGMPASDIKPMLNGIISKLTDRLKDKHATIRVEIVNIVTKRVLETEYKRLEPSFFEFE